MYRTHADDDDVRFLSDWSFGDVHMSPEQNPEPYQQEEEDTKLLPLIPHAVFNRRFVSHSNNDRWTIWVPALYSSVTRGSSLLPGKEAFRKLINQFVVRCKLNI